MMTQHSHADHRQPPDPAQRGSVPHKMGEFYPLDDIIAVVEDPATGERTRRALGEAGIPDGDIDVIDGAWFIERGRELKEARGFAERLGSLLASEERSYVAEYEDEARQGHSLIAVHAADAETAERVRRVLAAHGARRMRHYREHVIEELVASDR
jgi:hypothetical protein